MYLYTQLNDLNIGYRHIVVDECQDLSILELIIIKRLTKCFTFAGDFNQRIAYD
jgi:DNA helicase IV